MIKSNLSCPCNCANPHLSADQCSVPSRLTPGYSQLPWSQLLVKGKLVTALLHVCLVPLLKVLGQDDVAVLAHLQPGRQPAHAKSEARHWRHCVSRRHHQLTPLLRAPHMRPALLNPQKATHRVHACFLADGADLCCADLVRPADVILQVNFVTQVHLVGAHLQTCSRQTDHSNMPLLVVGACRPEPAAGGGFACSVGNVCPLHFPCTCQHTHECDTCRPHRSA